MNNFSTRKEDYQFQVECVSYLNLKQNKTFMEQVDKCLSYKFDIKTSQQTSKTLKQDNGSVIAIIMFYENRKSRISKVLSVVVY